MMCTVRAPKHPIFSLPVLYILPCIFQAFPHFRRVFRLFDRSFRIFRVRQPCREIACRSLLLERFRRALLCRCMQSLLFLLPLRSRLIPPFPHKSALALYLRIALRHSKCAVLLNNKAVLGLNVTGYCMVGSYKLFRNILCSVLASFLLSQQPFCPLRGAYQPACAASSTRSPP